MNPGAKILTRSDKILTKNDKNPTKQAENLEKNDKNQIPLSPKNRRPTTYSGFL